MLESLTHTITLAFGLPGHFEWVVLLLLGLLIFGKRLPEVGRSIGRSIVEFKRGIKGIDEEIEEASSRKPAEIEDHTNREDLSTTPADAKVATDGGATDD